MRTDLINVYKELEWVFHLLDELTLLGVGTALMPGPNQSTLRPKRHHLLQDLVSFQVVLKGLVGTLKYSELLGIFHGFREVGHLGEFDFIKDDIDQSTFLGLCEDLIEVSAAVLALELVDEGFLGLGLDHQLRQVVLLLRLLRLLRLLLLAVVILTGHHDHLCLSLAQHAFLIVESDQELPLLRLTLLPSRTIEIHGFEVRDEGADLGLGQLLGQDLDKVVPEVYIQLRLVGNARNTHLTSIFPLATCLLTL